jgi:hypothetical protein
MYFMSVCACERIMGAHHVVDHGNRNIRGLLVRSWRWRTSLLSNGTERQIAPTYH